MTPAGWEAGNPLTKRDLNSWQGKKKEKKVAEGSAIFDLALLGQLRSKHFKVFFDPRNAHMHEKFSTGTASGLVLCGIVTRLEKVAEDFPPATESKRSSVAAARAVVAEQLSTICRRLNRREPMRSKKLGR